MYFLSKNMCFLRIVSKISAKPKKSGPADEFSGVFTPCDRPAGSTRDPASPLPRGFAEQRCAVTANRDVSRLRPGITTSQEKHDKVWFPYGSYKALFCSIWRQFYLSISDPAWSGTFCLLCQAETMQRNQGYTKTDEAEFLHCFFFEKQTSIFHVLFMLIFLVIIIFIIGLICLIRLMCR